MFICLSHSDRRRAQRASSSDAPPSRWPTTAWATGTPESSGFDSAKLAQAIRSMKQGGIKVHSLLLAGRGEVFLDAYFYPYDGSTYHDLASVTKSVTTTLIGIAADRGEIDLDAPILTYFPDYTVANRDTSKEKVTIRHLAGMTSGFQCIDYPTEETLAEMQASGDWVQFSLDRPMAVEPGKTFVYDSLGMHLLSAILEESTGKTALEYAEENLFAFLGITDVYWPFDPQGHTRGWGDLALHPRDAAKIGLLFQQDGAWDGNQIVPQEWVNEATKKHISTNRRQDYGYGWWIAPTTDPIHYYAAEGRNGQYIGVYPSLNLIRMSTGGGSSMGKIGPLLAKAIGDGGKALPANPLGVKTLEAAVTEVAAKPTPATVIPLPDITGQITGKTYIIDENPVGLRMVKLEFSQGPQAKLTLDLANEPEPRISILGLDEIYRLSSAGRPAATRGRWSAGTFTIEYNEGPGLNDLTFHLRFQGEEIEVEIADLGKITGRQAP